MTPIKSESQVSPTFSEQLNNVTQRPWVRVALIVATVAAVAIVAATVAAILVTPAGCPVLIAGLAAFLIMNKTIILASAGTVGAVGLITLLASRILSNPTPEKEACLSRSSSDSSLASLQSSAPHSPREDSLEASGLSPQKIARLQEFKRTYNPNDTLQAMGIVHRTEQVGENSYRFEVNPTFFLESVSKPNSALTTYTHTDGVQYEMAYLFFADNLQRAHLIRSMKFDDQAPIQIDTKDKAISAYSTAKELVDRKCSHLSEAHRKKTFITLLKYLSQFSSAAINSINIGMNAELPPQTRIETRNRTTTDLEVQLNLSASGIPEITIGYRASLTAHCTETREPVDIYRFEMDGSSKITVPADEDYDCFTETDPVISKATLTIY